ncbi:MAG: hypothetical protein CMJ59_02190 [Planctomycetaceae bacterium]|nr:hypothetical protein [Planctomycetaceae bacterium]
MVMLAIALYYRRYAKQGLENFFLAGRRVPGWLNGVSYAAAMVSADAATAYGGLAAVTGLFICWWYLSRFALAFFIAAVLFAVFWRRLGLFTSMEFYELRFAGRPARLMRLWIGIRTSLVAMPAWTGITLLASAKLLEATLDLSKTESMLLVVPVSFAFVFLSGYKGVVVSNLVQMLVFFSGALLLAVLTLVHFGGPQGFADAVRTGPPGGTALSTVPPTDHAVFPLIAAVAWMLGQTIGYGGDAAPMGGAMEGQRILSSKTPRAAALMFVVTAFVTFTMVLLVSLPCVAAPVLWPELRQPDYDRELAYGLLMKELLPPGALGLVAAAMLAGVMSTVADNLNFGGQVLVNDVYRRWMVRDASERHYVIAGKLGMLLILSLALSVVYTTNFLYDVAVFMLQMSAAELPANWAQWWWWRFNGKARIAASFGGGAIFFLVVLVPKMLVELGFEQAEAALIPWWWQTFIVMVVTTALWVTVALLTKPDPIESLERFYDRARPLGSWAPVIARLESSEIPAAGDGDAAGRGGKMIGKGLALSALGTISAVLFILGLSHLYVGSTLLAVAESVLAIILLTLFCGWLGKYVNALDTRGSAGSEPT